MATLLFAVREHCYVVAVRGELDEVSASRAGAAIAGGNEGRPVVIDLTHAPSLSSDSIRGLLRSRNTPTAVVCAPGSVSGLLAGTPLDGSVPVSDDLATAIGLLEVAVD